MPPVKSQLSVEMTGDERKLAKRLVAAEAKIQQLTQSLGRTERVGRKTGASISRSMRFIENSVKGLVGMAGLGSIAQALQTINRGYDTWIQNQREVARETTKATNEFIAFAALQEGGTKAERVHRAANLAASYGITERGEAFNTIQALQSAYGGDFEKALKSGQTVFAATQLGIPLESASEAEVFGASLGLDPGQAIRRAYVAGEASSRDPKTLAKAIPGLTFFNDKLFGQAVATALAGSVEPDELRTFTKAAGIALSTNSAEEFQKTFAELGVDDGTQIDKLRALSRHGITTAEQLGQAGLKEIRQVQALATITNMLPEIEGWMKKIDSEAVPGLFARERAEVEKELPTAELARQNAILRSQMKDEQAFDTRALENEQEELLRGRALRKHGIEQVGFWDTIDESGRTDAMQWFIFQLASWAGGGQGQVVLARVEKTMESMREELEKISKNTLDTSEMGKKNSERRRRIAPEAQTE